MSWNFCKDMCFLWGQYLLSEWIHEAIQGSHPLVEYKHEDASILNAICVSVSHVYIFNMSFGWYYKLITLTQLSLKTSYLLYFKLLCWFILFGWPLFSSSQYWKSLRRLCSQKQLLLPLVSASGPNMLL